MLPTLRRSIKTDISKNRSLKDILSSSASALEIISVQPLTYNVYNTKTIAIIEEDGVIEKRSLVYNRLNVNLLLQSVSIVGNTINEIIDNLNDLDFDFTTDDLDLVNGMLITKPTSLGYYGAPILVGEILPEANVDTMMLLEQPAWLEPLYDIVINDELFSMSNVLLLDTSTHAMFDREASAKKSPVPIDVGFPPGLKDLLDIFQQPESTGVLFRNRTNQELHVKLIPRNANMFSNYDHLNEAVFYDADGYLNFILAPKQTYNKATDDLVVIWGFNPESNLTSEYPMMIGINPSYFYMVSPGDYVEIETTLTPSSGNGFSQTGTNPDTGAGIWRFELFSDLDPYINDPAITGIRYIWMEFDGVIGLEPSEVRVRSNKPIHQMELWNIIEVVNWGKYVVDQPYEVGDDVAASPMKSVLTKVGETSYTVPGALLNPYGFFKHENHPTPTFNVYEYVKRAGTGMEDLYIDVPRVAGINYKPRETQISDWFLNKPTLISNATPIFNDTSNPKYETSSISVPLKTLEVRLKAEVNSGGELKTLAALFPAGQSRFIKRNWVGSLGLPSKDFLTYQFDSVNNEDVYTIDIAGFIASGDYDPSTPYTQNDLRLLLKARWSSAGTGNVLMKVKGISPTNTVVHQWQDVVETNIFGSQPNIWRDFIIFSESLHIGGLVPHPLHLALLGGVYRYPTGYKTENWVWGYSGQMVRNFDETPFPRPFISQTFEGATNKVYIEPKLSSTDYILDRNGTVSINDGKKLDYPSSQWCEPVRPKNNIGTSVDLVQSPNSMFTKQEKINILNPNAEYSDVYFLLDEGSEIQNAIDIANALRKSSTTLLFEKDGVGQAFNNGFDTTPFLKDAVESLVTQLGTTTNIVDLDFAHTVVYDKFNVPFSACATGIGDDFLKMLKQLNPSKSFDFLQLNLTLIASAWTLDNVMVNNVLKTSQTVFNIYFSFSQVFRQNLPTVPYDSYAFYNDSTREYSFFNNYDPGTIPGQTKYSMMPVYPNNIRTISSIEGDASVLESRMAIEFAMPDNSTKIYTVGNEPSNLLAEPYVPFLKKSGNQVGTLFDYYLFYGVISNLN